MSQTEATRQSDWILPPIIDTTGLYNGTPNGIQLASSTSAVIVDLFSLPPLSYLDRSANAAIPSPLGHYICIQARGSDLYVLFGSSFASMTATLVSSALVTNPGGGYTSAPTVTFSGGGGSTQATATALVLNGQVAQILMLTPGAGYSSAPSIAFTGGGGSNAAATAVLGKPPTPTVQNVVSSTTGVVTMAAGTSAWIPQGQTASFKLPLGASGGNGNASAARFMGFVTAAGTGTLHLWQSSPP